MSVHEGLNGEDHAAIEGILVGRRIVDARSQDVRTRWGGVERFDVLELDDGTQLRVHPNEGCGWCTSGNYWVNQVAAFDNVITGVTLTKEEHNEFGEETLRIHVYAEGVSAEVISVSGDEGNGWYGRGFMIEVVRPRAKATVAQNASWGATEVPF